MSIELNKVQSKDTCTAKKNQKKIHYFKAIISIDLFPAKLKVDLHFVSLCWVVLFMDKLDHTTCYYHLGTCGVF